MPYGFMGNSCGKYLSNVGGAITSANAVSGRDPLAGIGGGASAPPKITTPSPQTFNQSPDTATSGGYRTGVGNQSNVVVEEETYGEIFQRIRAVDSGIAEELYNIAAQIEQMCETDYVVPATLPKYLSLLGRVKGSLGEFQSLADKAGAKAYDFAGEIAMIDG